MNDGLFSDFKAGIFSQWQKLKSYELLTQRFSENLTHAWKQLDCNNSVLFVRIIVGHFYDMS